MKKPVLPLGSYTYVYNLHPFKNVFCNLVLIKNAKGKAKVQSESPFEKNTWMCKC